MPGDQNRSLIARTTDEPVSATNGALQTKRQDIELARLISAFGIVWYHAAGDQSPIAYGGLIVYLMLSIYLSGNRLVDLALVRRRASRIIIPWVLWSALYGLANLVAGRPMINVQPSWWIGVLAGPSIHLWYLPYIFMVLLLLDVAKRYVRAPQVAMISATSAALMILCAPTWRPVSIAVGYPIAQWAHALPAVLIGIYFLCAIRLPKVYSIFGVLVITVALLAPATELRFRLPYLEGTVVMALIATGALVPFVRWDLTQLSECTFGVYLCHAMFQKVLSMSGMVPGGMLAMASFLLSTTFVLLARQRSSIFRTYMS